MADSKTSEKEAREYAESIINTVREPLIFLDHDLKVVTASRSFYDAFKVSTEETEGQLIYDLGNKQWEIPELRELLETILPQKTTIDDYEIEHKFADTGRRTMLVNAREIPRKSGKERLILLAIEDITERKRLENLLSESEKRYRRLFETANDGILLLEKDEGKITHANPAITEMLGFFHDEILGKDLTHIGFPNNIGVIQEILQTLQRNGILHYKDASVQTKTGQLIDTEIYMVDKTRLVQCNIRDISERKQAEKEREKLQAQLSQAQKMESIGQLAGGVAHDFNNMLSIINGYAEMSIDMLDPTEPVYENVREIYKAGKRSEETVRQLLAFARKQIISPVQMDLNDTVSDMVKMLQRLIGENIELAWHPGNNLWPVKIDSSQLDQIMANLAINARDAITDGGNLTIETKNVVIDEDYCRQYSYFVPGKYVMLTVNDTGCGMDRVTQDNIFEPFFTTKDVGEGTGLGLPTVYGIVKQNNGFINVYSEPGEGTTFKIYFHRHEEQESAASEPVKASMEPIPTGSETILLVEDDAAILQMGRQMLEKLGYTVLTATKPDDALQIAEEHGDTLRLLITDVIMPVMKGPDLAAKLSVSTPDCKTIYMSGYTENAIAHHGVLDEGVQFIQKPFSIRDLAAKVREVIGQE